MLLLIAAACRQQRKVASSRIPSLQEMAGWVGRDADSFERHLISLGWIKREDSTNRIPIGAAVIRDRIYTLNLDTFHVGQNLSQPNQGIVLEYTTGRLGSAFKDTADSWLMRTQFRTALSRSVPLTTDSHADWTIYRKQSLAGNDSLGVARVKWYSGTVQTAYRYSVYTWMP